VLVNDVPLGVQKVPGHDLQRPHAVHSVQVRVDLATDQFAPRPL
jgi:hypothetical protein